MSGHWCVAAAFVAIFVLLFGIVLRSLTSRLKADFQMDAEMADLVRKLDHSRDRKVS